ncbi:MAG: 16S rRNA (guanine(966)-N(2))-methyltransferase RsmD [bacterium]
MMRILSGMYCGRLIKGPPKGSTTRPILGRIKKSLFDIINTRIPGSRFLDLYAGTGSVGLEALSRGAKLVVFIDNDKWCIKVITDNVKILKAEDSSRIIKLNILAELKNRGMEYDIIFIGSPYKTSEKIKLELTVPTLKIIWDQKLLSKNGLIVAQHHVKESVTDSEGYDRFRREKYGDSFLSFYRQG